MLVMSRRQGETILIGDDIEIVIAHIARSRVKVGIRAPREMGVIARQVKLVRERESRGCRRKHRRGRAFQFLQELPSGRRSSSFQPLR